MGGQSKQTHAAIGKLAYRVNLGICRNSLELDTAHDLPMWPTSYRTRDTAIHSCVIGTRSIAAVSTGLALRLLHILICVNGIPIIDEVVVIRRTHRQRRRNIWNDVDVPSRVELTSTMCTYIL